MSSAIKIAFVGTSCIGKTTLIKACSAKLGDQAIVVEEAAREYFTVHPEVTERFGLEAQDAVQALALQKETAAAEGARVGIEDRPLILCDRSVFDAAVYLYSQRNIAGAEELFNRLRTWLSTHGYSKVFLLDPRNIPYETDEIRTESEATRQLFHDAFIEFFNLHNVAYELLSGTVDERLQRVEDFILTTR